MRLKWSSKEKTNFKQKLSLTFIDCQKRLKVGTDVFEVQGKFVYMKKLISFYECRLRNQRSSHK